MEIRTGCKINLGLEITGILPNGYHTLDSVFYPLARPFDVLEVERRVSADNHTEYEVDYRFAKQRIRLRYSTNMKEVYIVENDGALTPVKLLNKQENALIKREKVYLYRGEG